MIKISKSREVTHIHPFLPMILSFHLYVIKSDHPSASAMLPLRGGLYFSQNTPGRKNILLRRLQNGLSDHQSKWPLRLLQS
jgi:hypothetical protein